MIVRVRYGYLVSTTAGATGVLLSYYLQHCCQCGEFSLVVLDIEPTDHLTIQLLLALGRRLIKLAMKPVDASSEYFALHVVTNTAVVLCRFARHGWSMTMLH